MEGKTEVKISDVEREVLGEASRGKVVPTKSRINEFKSLLAKKLIENKGNNKYQATKLGLYVLTETVTEVSNSQPDAKTAKVKAGSTAVKAGKKKPDFLNQPKLTIAELDARYSKAYPHYVKGSVKESKGGGKRMAQIQCTTKGCKETRQVFTSDVFQVKRCEDHRNGNKVTD